jgi:DNA-binding MarR family transcriptional regulator
MGRPAKRTPLPPAALAASAAARQRHDHLGGRSEAAERGGAEAAEHGGAEAGEHGVAERAALDLDRLIHERLRLGIVSALAVNERLTFNDLKSLLRTTDGNLSVHARKLEEAGYVRCEKSFVGRLPKTEFRLTAAGKRALERYLDHMEAIIHATRAPEGSGSPT